VKRKGNRWDDAMPRRVEVLKALANPTRLSIVMSLCRGSSTVSALAESLDLKPCIVSQQLGILRLSRIVQGVRHSGYIRYTVIDGGVKKMIRAFDSKAILE
jgi:DNA-binding transcriptional ArsR family regulator